MDRKGSKRFRRTRNIMQSLRRRLSFRKKKDSVPECSKPHQWQEDEKKVRDGTCSFQVRYLGYIEVFDSRGMHVCEEAVKALKAQCKGKYQRAVLYVSGDALRVVDEISKSMIVDQTIEKVSFCAPDRNHDKGFAYICRDGTTRRWMCHGFLAVKESGERLSHAVGCAFAICLEKKQKRDKETGVTVTFNSSRTSFERTGSFRQTTLTEKLADPQSAIVADPVPVRSASNPFAVQRPHASANLLERQGSFRGFGKLQETSSPFKHTLSLRLNELPSTLQRQNAVLDSPTQNGNGAIGGTIPEASQEQEDSIAKMCQQLTQGLTALTTDEQQTCNNQSRGLPHQASLPISYQHQQPLVPPKSQQPTLLRQHTSPASQTLQPSAIHQPVTNPWANNTSTNQIHMWGPGATGGTSQAQSTTGSNPFASITLHQQTNTTASSSASMSTAFVNGSQQPPPQHQLHQQHFIHSGRSHSIDTGDMSSLHLQQQQYSRKSGMTAHQTQNGAASSGVAVGSNPWPTTSPPSSSMSSGPGVDPFDVAWAAKSVGSQNNNPNPFGSKSVQQFEVKL